MRVPWRAVAIFTGGFLVGAVAMGFAMRRNTRWLMNLWQTAGITEMAFNGQELGTGHADRLAERISLALPQHALRLAQRLPDPEAATALWVVRHYYERTHRQAPPELADILAALPAKYESACPKPPRAPEKAAVSSPSL
jgi:hypothetical protein